jgi:hypothetical protein
MAVLTLQTLHEYGDPLKGHPSKSIKVNCTKHVSRYFRRIYMWFLLQFFVEIHSEIYKI